MVKLYAWHASGSNYFPMNTFSNQQSAFSKKLKKQPAELKT